MSAGVRFRGFPPYWTTTSWGGRFISVRNVIIATTTEVLRDNINPVEGGYKVEFIVQVDADCALTIGIHSNAPPVHYPKPFSHALSDTEVRSKSWFDRMPTVDERYAFTYAYAWWVMAINLLSPLGAMVYEVMSPSKLGYVGLWSWDNAMHTLACRYVDAELARNQIRASCAPGWTN